MAWHEAAKTDELPEGEMLGVTIGKTMVALYNVEGSFYATSDVCTHQFARMSDGYIVDDNCIECPLHQGVFDIRTGEALEGPVDEDLPTFPVKVENGTILVELQD